MSLFDAFVLGAIVGAFLIVIAAVVDDALGDPEP